ncbi:putative 26S proteasome regulatory subunit [Lambiella insularis]|nr:putative 26S proteasome regulatory subunit [Lambiella insularis]
MDDIHTPTVPSGPVTASTRINHASEDNISLMELISEKERVESELTALSSVLDSHGVNMNTTLTTFDGFPRNDLDIAQIRTTRARVIRLRNDYKGLMSRIEEGLHLHYSSAANINTSSSSAVPQSRGSAFTRNGQESGQVRVEPPFAKVNSVVDGSPADQAGLKAGDEIRQFGEVNWRNHEKLSKVAEAVQRHEGRSIVMKVVRRGAADDTIEELELSLTPRRDWGGRGLLGCHLLAA